MLNQWHIKYLFEKQFLLIDLRFHRTTTKVQNHGTGFRISMQKIPAPYRFQTDLDI